MRAILRDARIIAVIGASDKTSRASYEVMEFLQHKGFRCLPVSPRLAGSQLLGETVYASLADIPDPVDMVDMFINSEAVGAIVDEAIAVGAKAIWMQLGVVDEAAAERARAAGLNVVMDRCPRQQWAGLGLDDAAGADNVGSGS
ncbi:CoA-binding protein [Seongchinamella sediminis]|uniref:CoA-binding protein n=1 Tax=Seongchinamella sediminis TaxID=2283635 RepID=A0A3L7DX23_9GAMM|nr:CoA-binding protein [Seongchinamella sediminis]RLQ20511.1 CoA-binding protein [Seongchinamella sediminis]